MTENMKKFLEAVSKSKELGEKASTMDKDALVAAAKELGIELTEADFTQPDGEMNADELETVAGGGICRCGVGGGGVRKGDNNPCGCAFYGIGMYEGGKVRCECLIAGQGGYINCD